MDELKENIVRMSSGSAESQAASDWLAAFQESDEAWAASCQLLLEVDAFKLYGLSILYNKLKTQFSVLEDKGQVNDLKGCLSEHLTALSQTSPINMVIGRYMALCLSNIYIQIGSDTSIDELFAFLRSILQYSPLIVLEVIKILPEECNNSTLKITRRCRERFEEQMGQNLEFVLQFLHILCPSAEIDVKVAILNSAQSWLPSKRVKKFPKKFISYIDSELIRNSLTNLLTSDETFAPSLDIWNDILMKAFCFKRRYDDDDNDDEDNDDVEDDGEGGVDLATRNFDIFKLAEILRPYLPVIQKMWSDCLAYMSANGIFDDPEGDLDTYGEICVKIATFFNDYSTLFIDTILSGANFDQQLIITQLVECFKCPIPAVVDIVSDFFHEVSKRISSLTYSEDKDKRTQGEYLATQMMPIYSEILISSIEKSIIPSDKYSLNNIDTLNYNAETRRYCKFAAIDCFGIMGARESLSFMNGILQREITSGDIKLNRIEAIIKITKEIMHEKVVDRDELCDEVSDSGDVTHLIDFLFTIPRDDIVMYHTIISFIKSFSSWFGALERNPTYIQQAMNIVVQGLSIESLETFSSQVFYDLCECCDLSSMANDIIQVYTSKRESGFLCEESEKFLVQGIMSTLQKLSDAEASLGLSIVLDMIVTKIQTCGNNEKIIDREFVVLKAIASSNIKEDVFISVFPSLLTLSEGIIASKTSSDACEDVISFLKNSVRKCKSNIATVCPVIAQFIVTGFTQFKYGCFLYLGSVLVRFIPNNEDIATMVYNVCSVFISSITISHNQNLTELEELLYLIRVSLDNILQFFVTFDNFSVIINMVLLCLKQPFKGFIQWKVYDIIDRLFSFSQSSDKLHESLRNGANKNDEERQMKVNYEAQLELEADVFEQLHVGLLSVGQEIVTSAIQSMSGNPYCYALFHEEKKNLCEMLWSVKRACNDEFPTWLQQAIEGLDTVPKAIAEKIPLMVLSDIDDEEQDDWYVIITEFTNEVEKRAKPSK